MQFTKKNLMKKVFLSATILFTLSISVSAQNKTKTTTKPLAKTVVKTTSPAPGFKNLIDSFSYAAGFNVATNMQAQGINKLNAAMMQKGIEDVFKKNNPLMTQEAINACMQKQLEIFNKEKSESEKAKGIAFLEANKKRPGVITTASGLQYEVIKNGDATAPMPKKEDTVVVNYKVSLIDGKPIENSFESGQPAVFPVTGVIKGWIEVLQLMRKGDHWKVYVPNELAYGGAGNGPAIPPYATLLFELSLEDIRPAITKPTGN